MVYKKSMQFTDHYMCSTYLYCLVSLFNNKHKLTIESINEGKLYTPYVLAKFHANLCIADSYEIIIFKDERGISLGYNNIMRS